MTDKEKDKKPGPEQAVPETGEAEAPETPGAQQPEETEPAEEAAEEEPAEPAGPREEDGSAARIAELERELLQARCRLAAYAAGVDPELAEDAVTLAIGAAQREGEVTEESVTRAMAGVLQRHPDWKNGGRNMAGFRLGADTDPAAIPAPGGEPEPEKRRWNRFK